MRTPTALALVAAAAAALAAGGARGAATAGPAATSAPAEVGPPVVGQRITAEPGTWKGSGAVTYHYQWYRCDTAVSHCGSIHGATGRSYRVVPADVGHTIALTVTATDTAGSASAYASAIGPVVAGTAPLQSTVQPAATSAGGTVGVDAGTWSQAPASVAYAWLRCNTNGRICSPIQGASAASYLITSADAGHALVALVTATAGPTSQAALSTAVTGSAAQGGTTPTGTGPTTPNGPSVAGSPLQGSRLTATAGTWTGSGTITYHYQWYRCDTGGAHCGSVHGATAAGYTLGPSDVGHTIGLTVTATDASGKTDAYASLVGPVAAAGAVLVASAQPTVSGTPAAGKALTVANGTWTGSPAAYSYAWERCNQNGRVCSPIPGATSASYTVTSADSGHRLLALVQATAGNSAGQALSTALLVP